ncbi:hypothetical protein HYU16_02970 [Candidatus Woesearchaeota archaeon]|nr:hypothetical protein [Candidatus Woesearchaeota archaeon]
MNELESVYGRDYGSKGVAAAGATSAVETGAETRANAAIQNLPDKKFKAGGITATVWKGISPKGTAYFNVQLGRSYKDNNWKNTSSLRENDVPKAMVLLQKAYEYVILQTTNAVLN